MATKKKAAKKKKHKAGGCSFKGIPQASPEKHLLRGFSVFACATYFPERATHVNTTLRRPLRLYRYFWGLSCSAARARNAYTGVRKRPPCPSARKSRRKRATP